MYRMAHWTRWAALGTALALMLAVTAQAQAQSDSSARSGKPLWWDVDWMMNAYINALTRHYNLSDDQEQYTRKFLAKRVKDFLTVYESDVRELMWEMFEYQSQQKLPPADVVKKWAKEGKPILEAAQKAILEGNKEWREILTDEQRKTHDADMRGLERQFKILEQRMDRWEKGEAFPADFGVVPKSPSQREWQSARAEDAWEIYFKGFAARYRLDAGQKETGQAILREAQGKAAAYRESHKAEFDRIDEAMKEMREAQAKRDGDPDKKDEALKRYNQLREERQKLEKPIWSEIGSDFMRRLDNIPTKEQKLAYESLRSKSRMALRERADRGHGVPSELPTTQPATAPAEKK